MYKASIHVTLRPSILDPQGKATREALLHLGYDAVHQVRMGKYVELWVDTDSEDEARRVATDACEKLLANPVVENYRFELELSGVTA
ncbi:MAG: phosphoribosylformylglycinamidine synthase subunit PurS [Rhodothermales bacterium]